MDEKTPLLNNNRENKDDVTISKNIISFVPIPSVMYAEIIDAYTNGIEMLDDDTTNSYLKIYKKHPQNFKYYLKPIDLDMYNGTFFVPNMELPEFITINSNGDEKNNIMYELHKQGTYLIELNLLLRAIYSKDVSLFCCLDSEPEKVISEMNLSVMFKIINSPEQIMAEELKYFLGEHLTFFYNSNYVDIDTTPLIDVKTKIYKNLDISNDKIITLKATKTIKIWESPKKFFIDYKLFDQTTPFEYELMIMDRSYIRITKIN